MKVFFLFSIFFYGALSANNFEKPYLGLCGSYGYFLDKSSYDQTIYVSSNNTSYSTVTCKNASSQYAWGITQGMGEKFCSKYYLGYQAALLFPYNSIEFKQSLGSFEAYYKFYHKLSFDICLHAGVLITPNDLFYILLGPVLSHFKYTKHNNIIGGIVSTVEYRDNYYKFGGKVGVGLAHAFCENWVMRFETNFSFYGDWQSQTYGLGGTPGIQKMTSCYSRIVGFNVIGMLWLLIDKTYFLKSPYY